MSKSSDDAVSYFNDNAHTLQAFYNDVERLHVLAPYLDDMTETFSKSATPKLIDIGAGCGTDAHFLLGEYEKLCVTAVEPSAELAKHAKKHARLSWVDDTLPTLNSLTLLFENEKADAVLMDAVFQYVAPHKRKEALMQCLRCLKPNGRIYMNFPDQVTRAFQHQTSAVDLVDIALELNLTILQQEKISSYNQRRSQTGKDLSFEYFTLGFKG